MVNKRAQKYVYCFEHFIRQKAKMSKDAFLPKQYLCDPKFFIF